MRPQTLLFRRFGGLVLAAVLLGACAGSDGDASEAEVESSADAPASGSGSDGAESGSESADDGVSDEEVQTPAPGDDLDLSGFCDLLDSDVVASAFGGAPVTLGPDGDSATGASVTCTFFETGTDPVTAPRLLINVSDTARFGADPADELESQTEALTEAGLDPQPVADVGIAASRHERLDPDGTVEAVFLRTHTDVANVTVNTFAGADSNALPEIARHVIDRIPA